ncbi:MAG: SMC family ATPase [Candidatus Abawacabacteria bacterium]|nr:SMC family ATPase [Candidatus Abawacabacteria bacterium]
MHPKNLYLKNFLSYGEKGVDIDFSRYHTLLFLGANGAGKSSILDAMLWAIWGKTRAGGDTEIMHSGSTDMEVRLDLVIRDHTYRIIRKKSKKGKGFVSILELQSLTEPITVLTDATISATQERINELIGIDYDLLISSAFLRQGDAQEFTQKSPSKRKELLATILNLERYVQWHEISKNQLREAESKQQAITQQKQYLLAEKGRISNEITQIEIALGQINHTQLTLDSRNLDEQIKSIEAALQIKQTQEEQLRYLENAHAQYAQKLASTKSKIQTLVERRKPLQARLPEKHPAPIDHIKLQALHDQVTKLQKAKIVEEHAKEKLSYIDHQLEQIQTQINGQNEKYKQEYEKLKHSPLIIGETSEQLAEKLLATKKAHETYAAVQNQLIAISSQIGGLEQELNLIVHQGNQIKVKKEQLLGLGELCPLCEQGVDSHHKETIVKKYDEERSDLVQHYNTLKEQNDQLLAQKVILSEQSIVLREQIEAGAKLQEAQSIFQQLQQLTERNKEILLNFEAQKGKLAQERDLLQVEIKTNKVSDQELALVQQQRDQLLADDSLYRDYQNYIQELQGIDKEVSLLTEMEQGDKKEYAALDEKLQELKMILSKTTVDNETLRKLRSDKEVMLKKQADLLQQKNLAQHLGNEIDRIGEQIKGLEEQLHNLNIDQDVLGLLVDAFGYRGIPTMIIEEAIPRLEQYANDILSFLSDNTMSIRFSLTRTSKTDKDTQIETLDILIGDTFGTRTYELFSGGEAFRIDIALRLALTKLLTERSNEHVDFLVIDEGFGSQDESGRDHIVQILHKLEKFFSLIIIITHVDELKETFPDRLLIRKGPLGSEVLVDMED